MVMPALYRNSFAASLLDVTCFMALSKRSILVFPSHITFTILFLSDSSIYPLLQNYYFYLNKTTFAELFAHFPCKLLIFLVLSQNAISLLLSVVAILFYLHDLYNAVMHPQSARYFCQHRKSYVYLTCQPFLHILFTLTYHSC